MPFAIVPCTFPEAISTTGPSLASAAVTSLAIAGLSCAWRWLASELSAKRAAPEGRAVRRFGQTLCLRPHRRYARRGSQPKPEGEQHGLLRIAPIQGPARQDERVGQDHGGGNHPLPGVEGHGHHRQLSR